MKVLKISQKNLKDAIKETIKSIKEGKVIICPTDTVYGLMGDASNEKAIEKVFRIKQRSREKAIPIFVKDIKIAKKLAFIDKGQERFLRKFWPGKLTVVLKNKGKLPKRILGSGKRIGLRIPDYKLVNILLEKLNLPLTGTSANISGKPPSGKIKEVLKQFGYSYSHGRIRTSRARGERALFACPDLIIDAGNLPKSKPSTVLDLTSFPPKILRP